MRRELEHFQVDGSCGWNQDWFPDLFMRMGGCAAVTACDACVDFALRRGRTELVPFTPSPVITRAEYLSLARKMKPFLHPRMRGIDRLSIYQDGFRRYLNSVGATGPAALALEGTRPYEEAEEALTRQIDSGIPVPFLTLRHRDPAFDFYEWHWYLLMGYDRTPGRTLAQALTYSRRRWLDFRKLWDTGYTERGGMILFSFS